MFNALAIIYTYTTSHTTDCKCTSDKEWVMQEWLKIDGLILFFKLIGVILDFFKIDGYLKIDVLVIVLVLNRVKIKSS